MELTLFGLAIAPGAAIAVYVYFRDKYEKEPLSLLLKTFAAGLFIVLPAALTEQLLFSVFPLPNTIVVNTAVNNFLFVGLTEELWKFFCLYMVAYSRADFNEPFDGIMYAVMVSMGFATAENLLYVMNGGMEVAVARIFTAVPAHATFAVLMGYFVGLAKFRNHHPPYLLLGIGMATIFHGAYDFFLSIDNIQLIALGALASLITGIILSFRAMKILNEHSPFRYTTIVLRKKTTEPL
ncbi:MAG: PrsW family glutamic-type intramembrane protease [Bacteriovoracaceae bacterium]|nr:PrsW family glutamic-type intramembrane protease [Bacteroidota bacterium]